MDVADKTTLTIKVQEALRCEGFDIFGIVPAIPYPEDAQHVAEWIKEGRNGTMRFMERNLNKRSDITALVEGSKSVIIAGLRYYNNDNPIDEDNYFVARYARVKDYHSVVKNKLKRILKIIESEDPGSRGRVFCDSAPVTEKTWAIRAGLGWRGRNSVIINEDIGSFFFLGEIVTSAEFLYDNHVHEDLCGTCHMCIDACPTGAICDDRTIDARRCIAGLTIEHDGELPDEFNGKTGRIIFGCDRCQEVCPWNKKTSSYTDRELEPDFRITSLTKTEWEALTPEVFNKIFRSSPVRRTGFEKIKRNILFVSSTSPEKR